MGNGTFQWLATFALTFVMMFVLLRVLFGIAIVHGTSMYPTYMDNQIVLINRLADYTYGDVVILDSKELNEDIIKRVIGLPGDTIEINDGIVYRNGLELSESYINFEESDFTTGYRITVNPRTVFVLGDNRANSTDSRYLGSISDDLVIGVVIGGKKQAENPE